MAIPYQPTNLNTCTITVALAILGSIAKFNFCQYFRLYSKYICSLCLFTQSCNTWCILYAGLIIKYMYMYHSQLHKAKLQWSWPVFYLAIMYLRWYKHWLAPQTFVLWSREREESAKKVSRFIYYSIRTGTKPPLVLPNLLHLSLLQPSLVRLGKRVWHLGLTRALRAHTPRALHVVTFTYV